MLRLDHLTVIAPTLEEGMAHVRHCLDLDFDDGRLHAEMGTHNRRLRLGDALYLEVIAVDPDARPPVGPRWFGLGDSSAVRAAWERGRRLRAWVARCDDFEALMRDHGELLGGRIDVGDSDFFSLPSDGGLPMAGILPCVIARADPRGPAGRMTDHGARLRSFELEHPTPEEVLALYNRLDIRGDPAVVGGDGPRYRAVIDTPGGPRVLT